MAFCAQTGYARISTSPTSGGRSIFADRLILARQAEFSALSLPSVNPELE
jgi:hypothetical protein